MSVILNRTTSDMHSTAEERRQRGAALQAWTCIQEARDLVDAQRHRQLARLACIADALRNGILAERHIVEKVLRTHDLIECRPGYLDHHQVDLKDADILQLGTIRRPTKYYRLNFDTAARSNHCVAATDCEPSCPQSYGGKEADSAIAKTPVRRIVFRNPRSSHTGGLLLRLFLNCRASDFVQSKIDST